MGPWVKVHWLLHEDSERAGTLEPHQTQEPGGSDIKKNTFESVLMRWMKLEPIYRAK